MAGILFDLDGVFYVGEQPIAGAVEALDWVRRAGIPHAFLTNTTSCPRATLVQRLARLGIALEAGQVLTPAVAAARWIATQGGGAAALFVPEPTREDFASLPLAARDAAAGVGAVVVGDLGEAWDFATLNAAFRLLMGPGRPALVALGMTRYWQAPDGLRLDVGPFVAALQCASGRAPVVLGKPAPAFFEIALAMIGGEPQDVIMVGDDIRGDVAGAQAAGLGAVLVRTGKFRPADLREGIEPQAVLESVADLPRWWGDAR